MKMQLEIQKPFDKGRRGPAYVPGKSLTEQSHKRECDMNIIVSKFKKTGQVSHLMRSLAEYQELATIDLHEAMNRVTRANEMFMELPSEIRKRFDNNPEKFYDFAIDEQNLAEMQKMGLLPEEHETPPMRVEVVNQGGEPSPPEGSE